MSEGEKSRREFFRAVARGLGLGGLAFLSGALAGRRAAPGEKRCVNRGVCGGCPSLEGCGLPQALSVKRAQKRN